MDVVIVKHERGYVAHIRMKDPRGNRDVASTSKRALYEIIERHLSYARRYA